MPDGMLWRQRLQIAKEAVYNTPLAATRVAYARNVGLTAPPEIRDRHYDVGRRDNLLSHGLGPSAAGGPVTLTMNPDELVEWALITFAGGVTPTTPVGATLSRLWTFPLGTTLDSMCLERLDGARFSRWTGLQGNEWTVTGNAAQANELTIGLMGLVVDDTFSALTGGLHDSLPDDLEGWETRWFLDPIGATPGTTEITDALISWNLRFSNQMERKKLADGTRPFNKLNMGLLSLTPEVRLEASSASMGTILAAANAGTPQLMRLQFEGPADGIEAGFRKFARLDIPGTWGSVDRNQAGQGSREYNMPMTYQYDPTNGFGVRLQLQNARTAAWLDRPS